MADDLIVYLTQIYQAESNSPCAVLNISPFSQETKGLPYHNADWSIIQLP